MFLTNATKEGKNLNDQGKELQAILIWHDQRILPMCGFSKIFLKIHKKT
jgi:hypothetical protein